MNRKTPRPSSSSGSARKSGQEPVSGAGIDLERSALAPPLRERLQRFPDAIHPVIIDLNLHFPQGREGAKAWVLRTLEQLLAAGPRRSRKGPAQKGDGGGKGAEGIAMETVDRRGERILADLSAYTPQYVFAELSGKTLEDLVRRDGEAKPGIPGSPAGRVGLSSTAAPDRAAPGSSGVGKPAGSRILSRDPRRAIYLIWPDFEVKGQIGRSIATVKADAAKVAYSAHGEGIVWAVLDSGIDGDHPHFAWHRNLDLALPLEHRDFTGAGTPLQDEAGHGTHVAGILAGEMPSPEKRSELRTRKSGPLKLPKKVCALWQELDETGEAHTESQEIGSLSGMAARCKLVSLKVLDGEGRGKVSGLIAALEFIQEMNGYGRHIRIHGANLSVGYPFDPKWFACGQSPLCVEVNRLARAGVIVVTAAGNTGFGTLEVESGGAFAAGLDLTINDPGNAEEAITVGSTHRDMPHVYGTSYFSSKGPTGDGRLKPDLLAPGEKILSCATGALLEEIREAGKDGLYLEQSGTSMAAPHVSGVIAAFLSIRREFIGQSAAVKRLFNSTATDLGRDRYFQGHGLVDLMRAIQSV